MILRSAHLLPALFLLGLVYTPAHAQQPVLNAVVKPSMYVRYWSLVMPKRWKGFQGTIISDYTYSIHERHLPTIFYDPGSSLPPARYTRLTDPRATDSFSEGSVRRGETKDYHDVLDIIGSRLRSHPHATIDIMGSTSNEPALGETGELAIARAARVRDYLIAIWGIDSSRMRLDSVIEHPSSAQDPLAREENRRVDIRSSDPAITIYPITVIGRHTEIDPETMHFTVINPVPDSTIVSRWIEITRNGQPWHVMRDLPAGSSGPFSYNWGKEGNEDSIPIGSVPLRAQYFIRTVDGRELQSNVVEMALHLLTQQESIVWSRRNGTVWNIRSDYMLALFAFGNPTLDSAHWRMMREMAYPDIVEGASVRVVGYTDNIGSEEYNLQLSGERARNVAADIRRHVPRSINYWLTAVGVGEGYPHFPNDTPEGRFFNRAVTLLIQSGISSGD